MAYFRGQEDRYCASFQRGRTDALVPSAGEPDVAQVSRAPDAGPSSLAGILEYFICQALHRLPHRRRRPPADYGEGHQNDHNDHTPR